jgi:hypothetical protein
MRLADLGSSSSIQPTNRPHAHDTSSNGAKAFETAMYGAKGETSFSAPASSQSPGRPIPPGGAYGNAASPGPGWAQPTDWYAHNLPGSSHPGHDPFNIIISGNSNVTLSQFEKGLEQVQNPSGLSLAVHPGIRSVVNPSQYREWAPVPTSASLSNPGTGPEIANVQPWSVVPPSKAALYTQYPPPGEQQQQLSMRVGGTNTEFSNSNINHFRLYQQQPLTGDHQGAYFIAASEENFHLHLGQFSGSFPWVASPYHDVAPSGFDQGRENLFNDIKTAAHEQGWNMQVSTYYGPSGTGSNGVHYSGKTYVITLTHASA